MEKEQTLDLSQYESIDAKARRLVTRIMCICYEQNGIESINTNRNVWNILNAAPHFIYNEDSKFERGSVVCVGALNQFNVLEVSGITDDSIEIGDVKLTVTGI